MDNLPTFILRETTKNPNEELDFLGNKLIVFKYHTTDYPLSKIRKFFMYLFFGSKFKVING